MNTAELDLALSRFRDAIERVGANLVALERDEVRELLEATPLRGETAKRWHGSRAQLTALFDDFARLTSLLDRATKLRSAWPQPSADIESQLTLLLQGP